MDINKLIQSYNWLIKELEEDLKQYDEDEIEYQSIDDKISVIEQFVKDLERLKANNKSKIEVSLLNVSREEQQELRDYLELNCWKWKEYKVV